MADEENQRKSELRDYQEEKLQELKFRELKNFIVDTVVKLKDVSEKEMRFALEGIVRAFEYLESNGNNGAYYDIVSSSDLDSWAYACAYVHRFGARGMALTRYAVLEMLKAKEVECLRKKFNAPNTVKVVVLGGSGIEVAGFASALHEFKIEIKNKLKITIVGPVSNESSVSQLEPWSSFLNILQLFIKEGNYGSASEYFRQTEAKFSFTRDNEIIKKAIREADVILTIRSLYSVQVIKPMEYMKEGAVALEIDESLRLDQGEPEYRYHVPDTDSRFGRGDDNSSKNLFVSVLQRSESGFENIYPPQSNQKTVNNYTINITVN